MERDEQPINDAKETGRIEAFSDGVFAVAITLLVLNIQVPKVNNDNDIFSAILRDQGPTYLAFVTSFFTIGIMWINHHRLFNHIKRSNDVLLVLNLLLLLLVVYVPFSTVFLTEYYRDHPDQHAAALLYSGTFVLLAICFNLLWSYASHKNRLLGTKADVKAVEAISRQYMFGPLLYLVAFVLAWFSVQACIALSLLLAIFFALPGRKRNGDEL